MFPCVWLHFKKFSGKYFLVFGKKEGKHKSENTSHNPEKKNHQRRKCFQSDDRAVIAIDGAIAISPSSRDRDRRRDHDLREIAIDGVISRRSRSCLREIVPSIAISDRDRAIDRDLGLELELAISDWSWSSRSRTGSSPLARARSLSLSLSLSLIFRKCFEGKIEV